MHNQIRFSDVKGEGFIIEWSESVRIAAQDVTKLSRRSMDDHFRSQTGRLANRRAVMSETPLPYRSAPSTS